MGGLLYDSRDFKAGIEKDGSVFEKGVDTKFDRAGLFGIAV